MFLDAAAVNSRGNATRMLYTIVMAYRGGTYISQVNARNVVAAVRAWAAALDVDAVSGLGPTRKAELIHDIEETSLRWDGPALLDGMVNAWCTTALTSGGLALINIVATVSDAPKHPKRRTNAHLSRRR
jgi:hypothetical protein